MYSFNTFRNPSFTFAAALSGLHARTHNKPGSPFSKTSPRNARNSMAASFSLASRCGQSLGISGKLSRCVSFHISSFFSLLGRDLHPPSDSRERIKAQQTVARTGARAFVNGHASEGFGGFENHCAQIAGEIVS